MIGFVLLEVLRVWFPSLLFVLGDAGDTSAVLLAVFGLVCFGIAPLVPILPFARARITPARLWCAGAGAVVLGRTALILGLGGTGRLVATSIAVIGASLAVVALAVGGGADRRSRVGLLAGLVGATCVHVGTGTLGLIWPETVVSRILSVGVVALLAAATVRTGRALAVADAGPARADEAAARRDGPMLPIGTGAAWPWLALVPMLVLIGMVSGVPGRTAVATGWNSAAVAATVAGTQLAALIAAALARRIGPSRAGLLATAGITGGTAAALDAAGWGGVWGPLALSIGLGLLLGSDLGTTARASTDRRRGVAAGLALLGFAAVTAVYYAAYDVALPVNNRVLLLATALLGGLLGVATFRAGREATVRATLDLRRLTRSVAAAAAVVALVAVLALPAGVSPAGTADGDLIRVATYNIRFGFDLDGRFAASEQAELLRAHQPDVVVLNEVDRGWLASGGHDALHVISEELGLPYVLFSSGADEVWGNALLSRYPIGESAVDTLPRGSDPMQRSQLVAVLELPGDRPLGVIGTHLSHLDDQGDTRLPQARAVAATVATLRERQVPTIVLGDLNAPPGSAELATFDGLVASMLPDDALTYPSDVPTEFVDHVLASSELGRGEVFIPESTLSDHRPVIVELRFTATP